MRAQPISIEMMAAGRAAFMRKRKVLDDLHQFFDADLEAFLGEIFRAMRREQISNERAHGIDLLRRSGS